MDLATITKMNGNKDDDYEEDNDADYDRCNNGRTRMREKDV